MGPGEIYFSLKQCRGRASRGEGGDKGNNTQNNTHGVRGAPLNSESCEPTDCVAVMMGCSETMFPLHPFTWKWKTTDAHRDLEALLKNIWCMSMMWWCFMYIFLVTFRQWELSFITTPAFKWHQIFQSYCNDLWNNAGLCVRVCALWAISPSRRWRVQHLGDTR